LEGSASASAVTIQRGEGHLHGRDEIPDSTIPFRVAFYQLEAIESEVVMTPETQKYTADGG
jgi:hypothetical protein